MKKTLFICLLFIVGCCGCGDQITNWFGGRDSEEIQTVKISVFNASSSGNISIRAIDYSENGGISEEKLIFTIQLDNSLSQRESLSNMVFTLPDNTRWDSIDWIMTIYANDFPQDQPYTITNNGEASIGDEAKIQIGMIADNVIEVIE
jgi:hypothetical protein